MMDAVQNDVIGNKLWNGNQGMWKLVGIEDVVSGIVQGIEQRSDMVVIPKQNTMVARMPGLLRRMIERLSFNKKDIVETIEHAQSLVSKQ